MAIPKISDLSLLAAIQRFSEPAAWAELELLLGLGVGTTEARAGWTENDWALRDFQVMLKLEVARKRQIEGVLRRWTQLTTAFRARLRSGELVATGYVKPRKLNDSRTAIPADKWQFLVLDFSNGTASGDGLEVVEILIDRAESQASRSPDKRVAHRPPTQRNNAKLAIKNLYPQGVPSDLKREALTTEVNGWLGEQKLGTVSADTIDRALGLRR